jgi:hypothetical protein
MYEAMRDCYIALHLDKNHLKSHFRLAKCLNDLKWHREAKECIDIFVRRFPDYASSQACESLIKDINANVKKLKEAEKKQTTRTNASTSTAAKTTSRLGESFVDSVAQEDDEEDENADGDDESSSRDSAMMPPLESDSQDEEASRSAGDRDKRALKKKKTSDSTSDNKSKNGGTLESELTKRLIKEYTELKDRPNDFKSRFSGHCNVATDIKECNYLGEYAYSILFFNF